METRPRPWALVLFTAVVLSLAGLATAGPGLIGRRVPPLERGELDGATSSPPPGATATAGSGGAVAEVPAVGRLFDILFLAFSAAIGLAVAAMLGLLAYRGIRALLFERVRRRGIEVRRSEQPTDPDEEAERIRGVVQAGLADLAAGGDPRRAVIACWLRLEQVAAAAGTARLVADTPADLVTRLLARHQVRRGPLEGLAAAYRRARYAPAEVGEDLAADARTALRQIAAELSLPVPGAVDR